MEEAVPSGRPREVGYIPWHLLYFHPEPHGHRSFRPTFEASAGAANGPARERRCSRFITDCSRSFNCFPAAKSCSTCHSQRWQLPFWEAARSLAAAQVGTGLVPTTSSSLAKCTRTTLSDQM